MGAQGGSVRAAIGYLASEFEGLKDEEVRALYEAVLDVLRSLFRISATRGAARLSLQRDADGDRCRV